MLQLRVESCWLRVRTDRTDRTDQSLNAEPIGAVAAVPERALAELRAKASGAPQGRLFVLSAPSGTGKDAVLAKLRERNQSVHVVVTCTTRQRRPGEIDGEHYRFVGEAEFLDMRARGDLLEDAQYAEHYYGVPADDVRAAIERGQDVIL